MSDTQGSGLPNLGGGGGGLGGLLGGSGIGNLLSGVPLPGTDPTSSSGSMDPQMLMRLLMAREMQNTPAMQDPSHTGLGGLINSLFMPYMMARAQFPYVQKQMEDADQKAKLENLIKIMRGERMVARGEHEKAMEGFRAREVDLKEKKPSPYDEFVKRQEYFAKYGRPGATPFYWPLLNPGQQQQAIDVLSGNAPRPGATPWYTTGMSEEDKATAARRAGKLEAPPAREPTEAQTAKEARAVEAAAGKKQGGLDKKASLLAQQFDAIVTLSKSGSADPTILGQKINKFGIDRREYIDAGGDPRKVPPLTTGSEEVTGFLGRKTGQTRPTAEVVQEYPQQPPTPAEKTRRGSSLTVPPNLTGKALGQYLMDQGYTREEALQLYNEVMRQRQR